MTPSPQQNGEDSGEYATEAEKMVATKNSATIAGLLRGIEDLERARDYQDALRGDGHPQLLQKYAAQRVRELYEAEQGDQFQVRS